MTTTADLQSILGLSGPLKGKQFKVKKTTISFGSNRKCDITLNGEYVSDLHAVVKKREDGAWIVQNNSVNGTLVNKERADLKVLGDGDRIQIGAASLFEVSFESGRKPKKQVDPDDTAAGSGLSAKQVLIAAGLLIYLIGMAAVAFIVIGSGDRSNRQLINQNQVNNVVTQTREFVRSESAGQLSMGSKEALAPSQADLADGYYRLRKLVANQGSAIEIDSLADSISGQIAEHLFRAWQYERSDQFDKAVDELGMVINLVPDIRSPSSKYAIQRIATLQGRLKNE